MAGKGDFDSGIIPQPEPKDEIQNLLKKHDLIITFDISHRYQRISCISKFDNSERHSLLHLNKYHSWRRVKKGIKKFLREYDKEYLETSDYGTGRI